MVVLVDVQHRTMLEEVSPRVIVLLLISLPNRKVSAPEPPVRVVLMKSHTDSDVAGTTEGDAASSHDACDRQGVGTGTEGQSVDIEVETVMESLPEPPVMVDSPSNVLSSDRMLAPVSPRVMELVLTVLPNRNVSAPAAPVRVLV